MAWTKTKTAIVTGVVVLLTVGTSIVTVEKIKGHETRKIDYSYASPPDLQGHWHATIEAERGETLDLDIGKLPNGTFSASMTINNSILNPPPKIQYTAPSMHLEWEGSSLEATLADGKLSGTWSGVAKDGSLLQVVFERSAVK